MSQSKRWLDEQNERERATEESIKNIRCRFCGCDDESKLDEPIDCIGYVCEDCLDSTTILHAIEAEMLVQIDKYKTLCNRYIRGIDDLRNKLDEIKKA